MLDFIKTNPEMLLMLPVIIVAGIFILKPKEAPSEDRKALLQSLIDIVLGKKK